MSPQTYSWNRYWKFPVIGGLLLAAISVDSGEPSSETSPQPYRFRVAIIPFQNQSSNGEWDHWGKTFAGSLGKQLRKVSSIEVVSQDSVGRAQRLLKLSFPLGLEGARKLGQVLEVHRVVMGNYDRIGSDWVHEIHTIQTTGMEPARSNRGQSSDWFVARDRLVERMLDHLAVTPTQRESEQIGDVLTSSLAALEHYSRALHEKNLVVQEEWLREAIALDPRFVGAQLALGAVLVSQGKREGMEQAKKSVGLAPNDPDAHVLLAFAHSQIRNDLDTAILKIEEALRLDPHNLRAISMLGKIYGIQKRWGDAIRCLEQARRLDPTDGGVLASLGRLYVQQGQRVKAEKLFRSAEPWSEGDVNAEQFLMLGYAELGDFPGAVAHYENFYEMAKRENLNPEFVDEMARSFDWVRARLTPHFMDIARPASIPAGQLHTELARRLSPNEIPLAVNPIQISPGMKTWAHQIAETAKNNLERARLLFEALTNRVRGRGKGGTRTAQRVYESWDDRDQSFSCQEYAKLYIALARELNLDAFYVHLEKDYEGKTVYHDCAVVFFDQGALLIDPAYHWFGIPHQEFTVLDDIQMTAHHAFQSREDGNSVVRCQIGIKLHPDIAWGHIAMARAYLTDGRKAEALESTEHAWRLEPDRWDAYLIRGVVAGMNGDYFKARINLEKARALNPESPEIHKFLGDALVEQAQLELALESYRSALRFDDGYHNELIEAARESSMEIGELLEAMSGGPTALVSLRNKAETGDPVAQHNLAICLSKLPNPDLSETVRWHSLAAEQGYAPAQVALGRNYEFGTGVETNLTLAIDWYRHAAEKNHADALYRLACIYMEGKGVATDPKAGLNWGRRAAERGHVQAQYDLGRSYYEGQIVDRNLAKAHLWFSRARDSGHPEARFLLQEIELFMTPKQISEAKNKVKE